MPATVIDTNLHHLLSVKRLYIPREGSLGVDALFAEDNDGAVSRFLVLMGSDTVTRDELLVLKYDTVEQSDLPDSGVWTDVNPKRTELVSLRRFLGGDLDALVEELLEITFESREGTIAFKRAKDDWGDWKLLMTAEARLGTAAKWEAT